MAMAMGMGIAMATVMVTDMDPMDILKIETVIKEEKGF